MKTRRKSTVVLTLQILLGLVAVAATLIALLFVRYVLPILNNPEAFRF